MEEMMKLLSAAILAAFTSAVAVSAVAQTAAPTQPQPGPSVGEPAQQAMTQTEKDARAALEKAGYTKIRDVKSTRDGVSAKATKDGKDVSVVVDTGGEIKAMQ
jgi:predicted aspartyl protease